MLIEIHMIQNHSPANLNRDDLGAPKTCYFGGVLRSRISSQCIKRSIRTSNDFKALLGGVRTRRLADLIQQEAGETECWKKAQEILNKCGFKNKDDNTKMLVFMSKDKIKDLARIVLDNSLGLTEAAQQVANVIAQATLAPDIALCGRMLEPNDKDKDKKVKWSNTTVEAALQVAHAISTHIARPEIDYFVAADDVPGEDAGAGHIGESMFASACFYKYFSIDWEQLVKNLKGDTNLAAHTVGAFLLAAAKTNPSGKQNSFAAHNYPDGILVEFKNSPISYANAFVRPVSVVKESDLVEQSIGQLSNYVNDIRLGYYDEQSPVISFWFSPNNRYSLGNEHSKLASRNIGNLNELVGAVLDYIGGFKWEEVQKSKAYVGG
jgi:CRISPR system Cascade subunit CasC